MATVSSALLKQPLSPDDPCGPDLEAEGDVAYLNVLARIEAELPGSFFDFLEAPKNLDLKTETTVLLGVLNRSRDLRSLVLLAKLSILGRDLGAFVQCLETADGWLTSFWAAVHPVVADGGEALRSAVLQSLDDMPTVILPLQHAILIESRRAGSISFRNQLIAAGEVPARANEKGPDAATIEQACADVELADLVATRDLLARLVRAIEGVQLAWMQNGGMNNAPSFERLGRLAGRMLAFLDAAVVRRAPDAAMPVVAGESAAAAPALAAPAAGTASVGRIVSPAEAADALASVIAYLAEKEPSSPSLLLVHQARQLIGRSFVDIMRLLVPEAIKDAKILVGAEQAIAFKLEQIALPAAEGDGDGAPLAGAAPEVQAARSRQEAQALLDEVAAFYQRAEPSNPIPLLCERARALISLDFTALLKEIMPKKK